MKEKINSYQLSTNVVSLSGAAFWGILTSYILYISKTASIISMLIGFIFSLIISQLILYFFKIYDNLSPSLKIKKIFGKLSIIINTLFGICTILIFFFLLYRLAVFLSSQYLIETKNTYFFALLLITTFYISDKGIETTTRTSIIFFYISIIIFLFNMFCLLKEININNYLPLITVNNKNILKSAFTFSMFFTIPTFFINVTTFNNIVDKEKFNKNYYKMLIISFIIVYTSILVTVGVYGINLTNLFHYPLYTVLKKITLFSFIDSIENISSILWILYTINASSIILLCFFNNIKDTFNIKITNKLKIIFLIILISISYIFLENNNFIETYNYTIFPLILTIILLILIIITIITYKIKKRYNN